MLCLFNMQLSCLMCCALSFSLSFCLSRTLLLTKITVVCSANNCDYYTPAPSMKEVLALTMMTGTTTIAGSVANVDHVLVIP